MLQDIKKPTWVDASILLAAMTAFVYFCTFEYEYGYCAHFNIPKYLIEPSVNSLLTFAAAFVVITLNFGNIFGFTFTWLKGINMYPKKHVRYILRMNVYLFMLLIFLGLSFPWTWYNFLLFFGFAAFANFATWGLGSILSIRSANPLADGVNVAESTSAIHTLWGHIERVSDGNMARFILLILISPLLSNFLGAGEALKQEDFTIFDGKPNTIAVRKYGENLICVRIDPIHRLITDTVFIYKINDKEIIQLNLRHIGTLHRKD